MADIIENVRASELLYDNFEVVYDKQEQLLDDKRAPPMAARSSKNQSRQVLQAGLIYFKHSHDIETLKGDVQSSDTLQGYDGEKTRILDEGKVGNVHLGKFEDGRLFHPHLAVLSWPHGFHRLSDYIAAETSDTGARLTWHIEGEETLNQLRCVRIRQESQYDSEKQRGPRTVIRLWLAIERNYLPIKQTSTRRPRKKGDAVSAKPYGIETVEDLREIAPGIWFPLHLKTIVYEPTELYDYGREVVQNRRELRVTHVDPNPKYDISLFREIRFPPGIPVYTVRDGKIIGTEIVPYPSGRGITGRLALLVMIAILLVAIAAIIVGRVRKRKTA
jgi:hypothetical protein